MQNTSTGGVPDWLRDVATFHVIGFSLTGFGEPTSFGKLLEQQLRGDGWKGTVREVSYGGLSINALAGLIPMAASAVRPGDVVALELATSFFSLHKYTLEQARPFVAAIARYFVELRANRVVFLNLFRFDLDDDDCVVRAIREVAQIHGMPVLDLKEQFRALSKTSPFGTTDGIHPDLHGRHMIARGIANFLYTGICPYPASAARSGPAYAYIDLVPRLAQLPRHAYEARSKSIEAAVAPAGFATEISLERAEHIVGYCFLYGPETGFIEITGGDAKTHELITFDEHSYYRRIGFRPLDIHGDHLTIRVPERTRAVALVRQSNLPAGCRCEFICGLVVKRPSSLLEPP